ncbi:MAG: hypothetical protein ACRC5M_06590 [Anaeroplasmataceae bacterium]
MSYVLILTEGTVEKAFIELLLDRKLLKFDEKKLFNEKIHHCRQLTSEMVGFIQLIDIESNVSIYRIGDKLSDKLKIPKSILKEKIAGVYDICTKPEFEMLLILHEGKYDDFNKIKSKLKPSQYYKQINPNFKKTPNFINNYFSNLSNKQIMDLIDLYVQKCGKNHSNIQLNLKYITK